MKLFYCRGFFLLLFLIFLPAGIINAADGDVSWTYSFWPYLSPGGDIAIGADGTVYLGSSDSQFRPGEGGLYAFNRNGSIKWLLPVDGGVKSTIVAGDGTIYITSGKAELLAVSPEGTPKWSNDQLLVDRPPAIGPDSAIYAGSGLTGQFYSINPADGSAMWVNNGVCGGSTPAVAADGTIYVYGCNNSLYAIDPNGSIKWNSFVGAWERNPPSIGDDGTIYAGGWNIINAIGSNGSVKWVFQVVYGFVSNIVIGSDGTVYAVSDRERSLYAINSDGSLKWIFTPEGTDSLDDCVIGKDGFIYIGGTNLWAINQEGMVQWMTPGLDWGLKGLTMLSDGTVLSRGIQSIWAHSTSSGGLAETGWPMRSRDPQRTSRQAEPPPPPTEHFPLAPVPSVNYGPPTLDYDVNVPWAVFPHNGVDYNSGLGDEVKSVAKGIVHSFTKPNARRFGSIDPSGKGPAIWVKYKMATGEPIYVLYGHTATSWDDTSLWAKKRFKFNCTYSINLKSGDIVGTGESIGYTAPFYNGGSHAEHLHISVFKPRQKQDGTYAGPPSSGWGYSKMSMPSGDYIDPKVFFNEYILTDAIE